MNRIALDTLILIALCNIVLIAPANAELKLGNKLAVAELANTQPKNLDSTQINTKSGNPLTPSNPVNASDKKHENPAKLSDNDRINLMIAEVLAAGVSSDHALKYFETQFDLIHKIYGIATGSIALLLLLAGVVGYKNINKIGEEAKSDFRDFENRMDRDLKNLRERLQNDIKQSQEAAKDQLEKEVKTLIEGEGSHQEKVDGRLAELTATIWEEFDNAAKISDCYSNVRMFESFMSLIKSIEEIESLGSIKQQKIEKTMEPLKQALEGSLKKLKQIITVYEGKRYDSDRLARVYSMRANVEKRLEKMSDALESAEAATTKAPGIGAYYYNAACYAALAQDKNKALVYLEQALSLTPLLKAQAKQEPDLKSLWGDRKFQELTA